MPNEIRVVIGAFQWLKSMGDCWKDESHKHYEPIIQVCEPLMQVGSNIEYLQEDMNNIHVEADELKKLDEEIQWNGLSLQELLDD